ncbi:MAG TPA: RHS repeat-associated core domain-containing protein [Anaerolineales bacterium]|nr:RHS repeat-associated core domain-containing protein [Anaerolineales bacterium]
MAVNGSTTNSYLYTGQQFDSLTGLYSLRARYYNPALGRFLSQDTYPVNFSNPVELNRYVYTANNPIHGMDPSGHGVVEYLQIQLYRASAAITASYFVVRGYYTLMPYILQLAPYTDDIFQWFRAVQLYITFGSNIISSWGSGLSQGGGGGGNGGGDDGGGGNEDDSLNYSPELQTALELLEELAPEYFDVLDSGEVILIDEGPGPRAGGSVFGDTIYIQWHRTNPFSTAFTLYEEMFHQYQGRMLMLDAEVEAMAATAEWVQRNGLTAYLTTDSGDDYLRLYLEEGEDALRARLKTAPL